MKIRINVTKEVLEKSKMCNGDGMQISTNCAVAVAVRDLFPKATMWVTLLTLHPGTESIGVGLDVSSFILEFDSSTPKERVNMTPISFEVEVPEELINSIGIEEVNRVLATSSTLQLV